MRQSEAGREIGARTGRGSFALVTLLVIALLAVASGYLFLPERLASLLSLRLPSSVA